jgi:hypothetical protein
VLRQFLGFGAILPAPLMRLMQRLHKDVAEALHVHDAMIGADVTLDDARHDALSHVYYVISHERMTAMNALTAF